MVCHTRFGGDEVFISGTSVECSVTIKAATTTDTNMVDCPTQLTFLQISEGLASHRYSKKN